MMVCFKSLFLTNQLTSMFSLPSATLSFSSSSSSTSTQVQADRQQNSTTAAAAVSSTCKRKQRGNGATTGSILFLGLLDLWGVVSIIILITTTGTPTPVSAASIAAVSIASNVYGDGKGNGVGGKLDSQQQQQHHHQPGQAPQPSKLSFLSGNDTNGNGNTVGKLNLPFGELIFANKLQQPHQTQQLKKQEMAPKSINNHGSMMKRNVGDTRIISHQDVTTLALAVDNSSSVAIANINSSFNSVFVSIGPKNYSGQAN